MSGDGSGISVHSGFPNAADDTRLQPLDLHSLLVPQPRSTFLFTIEDESWNEQGIFAGDIAVIDRALSPRKTDIVAWIQDDAFVLGAHTDTPEGAETWGVVTSVVHRFRNIEKHTP